MIIPITDGANINNNLQEVYTMNINGNYYDVMVTTRFNKLKERYYIKDINGDGIQELIFECSNSMISPIVNTYYIFNYIKGEMKQIGTFSIGGELKTKFEVSGNRIRQEYSPSHAKDGYNDIKKIELKLQY